MSEEHRNKGEITRRRFLSGLTTLGASAVLAPIAPVFGKEKDGPKPGGCLRIGVSGGSPVDSLDPATIVNPMMELINRQQNGHLVEIDPSGVPVPELAEAWETTDNAAKWVFRLRKGVEFHHGKTLDAEDVVFSIKRHRHTLSAAKHLVTPISNVKADGKYTVVFSLMDGNVDFPYLMSDCRLSIHPAGTTDWSKGMGAGPYVLERFEPGILATVEKNPNYWKEGRGHFDRVETFAMADDSERIEALKTGRIDLMNRCPYQTAHLMAGTPGIDVIPTQGGRHYSMPMLTGIKPYDNNHARLALKHAIDRDLFLYLVLRGYGYVGNDHPIGRNHRYYAWDLPQRRYDPDKSRYYLKKAGLKNYTFRFHTADGLIESALDAAVILKEHAARAGIEIQIVKEQKNRYWNHTWRKKPWVMAYWSGRLTEDRIFSTAYTSYSKWNDTSWRHPKFNKLLVKARAESNEKKRRDMYGEMQRIVRDEGGVIIPVFAADLMAASDKLRYRNVAENGELDGYRAPERWWFG